MTKPLIGVLAGLIINKMNASDGIIASSVNKAYINAVEMNGGIPVVIPTICDDSGIIRQLEMCDGILIPGGVDVDPRYYNENPHIKLRATNPEQDKQQMKVLHCCAFQQIPVLGICRGMQIMNVFTSGSLYQDLSQIEGAAILHDQQIDRRVTVHNVTIEKSSRLFTMLGSETVFTNSIHHQSIKEVGKGFAVTAKTSDGVIEAIEHENGIWLGVQWHPEELVEGFTEMNEIFCFLVEKAASRLRKVI